MRATLVIGMDNVNDAFCNNASIVRQAVAQKYCS